MLSQVVLTLANDSSVLVIGNKNLTHTVAIATDSAANAGCNLVVEIPASYNSDGINGGPNTVKTWVTVGLWDAISNANIAGGIGLTGPSKYAWANIPGADRVRVRRTDANAGAAIIGFGISISGGK